MGLEFSEAGYEMRWLTYALPVSHLYYIVILTPTLLVSKKGNS